VKKIWTDWLFTNLESPVSNGMLWINDDGSIARVLQPFDPDYRAEDAEYLPGWIVPGFVNAHCHLELSHLKGKIEERTGLNGFVSALMQVRNNFNDDRQIAIEEADREMYHSGIVAVADICNGNSTFNQKKNSSVYYHSLIERFGFNSQMAQTIANEGQALMADLGDEAGNMCLHAPYSASIELQKLVKEHLDNIPKGFYSIHHAESEAEIELFNTGEGSMADRMRNIGLIEREFPFIGIRPIDYLMDFFPESKNILLVHNTFISAADLEKLKPYRDRLFLCLCPNANLYIENTLPNIEQLRESGILITVGTDSLASNHQLDMLSEIKVIHQYFPSIPLEELFRWSSFNGAKLLGIEKEKGHFSQGSKPGIVHIQAVDNTQKKLTFESYSRLI
jgi:cytosine/adenosine deaminase-related metal-dependent hydrolase